MSAVWLYRIATGVLVVFAALHTYGFLNFVPPSPEGRAVMESMNSVHFELNGARFSYGGFYKAFGLFVSVGMLFSAFVAWHLSRTVVKAPQAIGGLAWGFFLLQAANLALCCIYFSTPQIAFNGVLAVCTGWAAFKVTANRQ